MERKRGRPSIPSPRAWARGIALAVLAGGSFACGGGGGGGGGVVHPAYDLASVTPSPQVAATDSVYAALTFLPEETIDENPRFHFIAVDPKEIYLIEAFEPEPRRPEQLKRLNFTVAGARATTERLEKK